MIVLDRLTLAPGLVLLVADEGDGVARPVPWLVDANRRAVSGDGAATGLVALLGGGSRDLGPFRVTSWHHTAVTGERSFGVDQTNESVVVGERGVVKWLRTAEPGPGPMVSHPVELAADSALARALSSTVLEVRSSHHQAVGELGSGLRAVAWAPDDALVEAVEHVSAPIFGVQWHPEEPGAAVDQLGLTLGLLRSAAEFSRADVAA